MLATCHWGSGTGSVLWAEHLVGVCPLLYSALWGFRLALCHVHLLPWQPSESHAVVALANWSREAQVAFLAACLPPPLPASLCTLLPTCRGRSTIWGGPLDFGEGVGWHNFNNSPKHHFLVVCH
uniref:Uncharacterized protein n=1 Tax=Sphaerodactylus townsendi TaxID=933632 RepID=A0ACB8EUA6_9SAUR